MIPYWHYYKLYKYETASTKCLMTLGVLSAFCGGFIFPAYGIVLGLIATIYDPDITNEKRSEVMTTFLIVAFSLAFL